MNKKKLTVIALAVCLIAILSFTTLAWFTDADSTTNTFTVGSIKIVQHEKQDEDGDGILEDFVDDKVLLPVVDMTNPSSDPNYEDKIVTVENTGNNAAYVRTHIAVPMTLDGYLHLDLSDSQTWIAEYTTDNVMIDGVAHRVYTYRYDAILNPTAETDILLEGVYLDASVDLKTNPATNNLEFCKWNDQTNAYDYSGFCVQDAEGTTYKVSVVVASQAVQAEGFGSAQAALDSAFGANSTPWDN